METLLNWIIGVGCIALLVAVSILLCLNASRQTLAPVISAVIVGAVATLVALVVPLKETTTRSDFTMSVVLNTQDGRPPLEVTDAPPDKANVQLTELFRLSRPTVSKDGKAVPTDSNPTNDAERIAFASELIQYRLLRLIQELQRGRTAAGFSYGTSFATYTPPIKTADSVEYPPAELLPAISANRFSNSDAERYKWQSVSFPLPKGATVRLHSPTTNQGGRYSLIIEKPLYFDITITIEPLPYTSPGILQQGLSLRSELAPLCQAYHFHVAMSAVFERLTAGNYRTQQYKDWVTKLFDDIGSRLSD